MTLKSLPDTDKRITADSVLLYIKKHTSAEEIREAVAAGADPNVSDGNRTTPLHIAQDVEQTRALLAAGADPNVKDVVGDTPLHNAHDAGQTQALLDAGADPNVFRVNGLTPLFLAQTTGQTQALLDAGADPNARTKYGWTPLHNAQDVEQTRALLAAGADPNVKDVVGDTPLHEAHSVEQARLLLDAGAEVPGSLNDRVRYIVAQVQMERETTVKQPKENTMTMKSLLDINENTTAEEIREAVTAGADVNEYDAHDEFADIHSPLHIAHNAEQTRALLEAGADPNAADRNGWTPLHYAHEADQIKALLDAGANVNARNNEGVTPLHLARDAEQARMLVQAGANVNARSDDILPEEPSAEEWRVWEQENAPQIAGRDAAGEDVYEYPDLPEPRSIPAREGQVPLQMASSPEQAKVLVDAGAHIPDNLSEQQQKYVAMAHADRLAPQPEINPAAARALKSLHAASQAPEQPSMRQRRRC